MGTWAYGLDNTSKDPKSEERHDDHEQRRGDGNEKEEEPPQAARPYLPTLNLAQTRQRGPGHEPIDVAQDEAEDPAHPAVSIPR